MRSTFDETRCELCASGCDPLLPLNECVGRVLRRLLLVDVFLRPIDPPARASPRPSVVELGKEARLMVRVIGSVVPLVPPIRMDHIANVRLHDHRRRLTLP